jgi:hypothetical protein
LVTVGDASKSLSQSKELSKEAKSIDGKDLEEDSRIRK